MKIGNPADKPAPAALANGPATTHGVANSAAARGAKVENDSAPTAGSGTTIALSSTASTLLTSGATAEFDAAKVARIAKAIEDGTFEIDPGAIADKLISNAQELLGKVRS